MKWKFTDVPGQFSLESILERYKIQGAEIQKLGVWQFGVSFHPLTIHYPHLRRCLRMQLSSTGKVGKSFKVLTDAVA